MHSPKRIELAEIFQKVEGQRAANLPFAIYSFPNSQEIFTVFQNDDVEHYALDFQESGFLFAPFDSEQNSILLKPDSFFVSEYIVQDQIFFKEINPSNRGKEEHINLINKSINEIKAGNLEKVVLSRMINVETNSSFLAMLKLALQLYTNAFCYVWYHPKVGMWLGASPEQLLSVNKGVLRTTSLAGTLPVVDDEKAQWTKKELDEQQMVTTFLLEELKEILNDIEVSKVESIKAGSLWHLKTNITATLTKKNDLKELIYKMHPSPAVCGLPKKRAKKFIRAHEGYARSFYTGFLGELNLGQSANTSLFVNLRCMSLNQNQATIFVGGGITKDSNPENEWEETENKTRTMLSLL
ncbi:chorismate-binding protein [Croceitalea rosinachiae]|uniref:isochorismate synthase n=1 Tax=Croceitalea rosinachiae TaxID=3075596 RepID=A0ABU3AAZ5_9FLAO|nr:chorismate-binding protein [Croceitalea sp. F388]MDT0607358.1 chorismate-binding protein [Croceitalea sp. F388]